MFEYCRSMRENTVRMSEKRITLMEMAAEDWDVLGDLVRDEVSTEGYIYEKEIKRIIFRATNPQFLTKDSVPNPEDRHIFVGALFQRYIEAADALGVEQSSQRQVMLAQTALALDVLRMLDWDELALQYRPYVPSIKKEGVHVGWLSMVSDSARMIRDDLGMKAPERKKRSPKSTDEEIFTTALGDSTPGFESLRSTIIELISNEKAPGMTRDIAAALLAALGIEKPRQGVSSEKLDTYKMHAMQWLGRKLSHTSREVHEDDDIQLKLERGRQDLAEVARKYPAKGGDMTASEWLVWRATGKVDHDYAKQVESHMALALHEMLVKND
jgi:hypothetical protein